MHPTSAVVVASLLAGLTLVPRSATAQDSRIARTAATSCAALATLQLPDVRITDASAVAASQRGITVPHCKVSGVIGREIHFEVLLPDDWNRRFVMGGGGGFVGHIDNQAAASVNLGYASAATDTGHQAIGFQASWALGELERQVNFGHLAVHRTTTVVKAIVRAYYETAPRYAYFFGCSNGGRQGLMEAQRYPDDFDGIVAGAPAFNFTRIAASFVRNAQATYPNPASLGAPTISRDNLALVASKVVDACDAQDGVKDGVLEDPRECAFKVSSLPACPDDRPAPQCVTGAQRAAIERIYAPVVASGKTVYAGQPFGGEAEPAGWVPWITGPNEQVSSATEGHAPSLQWAFGTEFFKYFVFADPTWDYTRYDLSTWERDIRTAATIVDADNPDLGAFASRRGKLLLYHGWSDAALNAIETIGYYDRVLARDAKMRDTARLFLLPGVQHCGGGAGADSVDWIGALANWVERGTAPERLVATKRGPGGSTVRTRPVCAYPQHAVHAGTGNPDEAESFVCRSR